MNQHIPFKFAIISTQSETMKEGSLISTIDRCGLFLCQKGKAEILLSHQTYEINQHSIFLYTPGSLLQILRKSNDLEGIMIEVSMNYIIPIVNKVANAESTLYLRKNPCLNLSENEFYYLEELITFVRQRTTQEKESLHSRQKQYLSNELFKSWGQTICYEILNIFFCNEPLTPLPQDNKDKIFQNFMLTLSRNYRQERDVSFYANKQCLSPRYFSTIIKEKSGSSALQWIIQMVITEARQLLENRDLSIKEIAAILNFPTQSFFGKYFKQYTGVSPKEYRKRNLS